VLRTRTRSLITIIGVGISIFLLGAILTITAGIEGTVEKSSSDLTLVVFQKNRY
jgi:ABC-type antimicrobial peptide transport system permease subunit